MHSDDVGISFDHIHAVLTGYSFLCLVDAVELLVLVVYFRVWRVDIFLLYALRGGVEFTSSEAHHLSVHSYPGEHHASCIAVYEHVVAFTTVAYSRSHEELVLIALSLCRFWQRLTVGEVVTQSELLYDVVTDAATPEILHTYGVAVGIVVQKVLEVCRSPFVDDVHRVAHILCLALLRGHLAFLYLYVIFVCQPSQRLGVGHLFVFHDKRYGVSTLSATETVTSVTCRRNYERRCAFVMERA